jgi:SAM-dependent methyltransferase
LAEALGRTNPLLKRLVKTLYPPMPTLNIMSRSKIEAIQGCLFLSGAIVVNIGSGGLTGCGYRLWKNGRFSVAQVFHLDILDGDSVSLLGDAHRLPFQDKSIDSLICQAVLEHVQDPRRVIDEAARVLKPGGYLYLEVPFLQGFHADPHDFQRYTLEGLRIRTRALTEIDAGVSVGPFCALVWIVRDGVSSCFRNPLLYAVSRFVAGWALSPVRYLDYLIRGNPAARRLACEYYFLCRKPL